jgi:hypothetical protein
MVKPLRTKVRDCCQRHHNQNNYQEDYIELSHIVDFNLNTVYQNALSDSIDKQAKVAG